MKDEYDGTLYLVDAGATMSCLPESFLTKDQLLQIEAEYLLDFPGRSNRVTLADGSKVRVKGETFQNVYLAGQVHRVYFLIAPVEQPMLG